MARFERLAAGHRLGSFRCGNDELDSWLRDAGITAVVDAIDDRAAAFYEHFGFRAISANPDRFVMKASTAAASLSIDWPLMQESCTGVLRDDLVQRSRLKCQP